MIFGRKKNKSAPPKSDDKAAAIDITSASAEQLLDVVCESDDPALRTQALAKISSQSDLAAVLKSSKYPDVRSAAAEQLADVAIMRSSYQLLRQKDKSAARILKAKLDDIDAVKQEQQQKEDALHGVMDESVQLATGAWSPAFNARYQALLGRWQHMEGGCSMAEKLHFQANQRRIEDTLEEHRPRLEAPAKQENVCESLELICGALQQASLMEAQIACAEWGDIIAADETRWAEAATLCEPNDDVKQRYDIACDSLHAAIQVGLMLNEASQKSEDFSPAALQNLSSAVATADWKMGDVPIWFFELNALIEEVRENQSAQDHEQDEVLADLHKAFASLRRAIKDGRLIPAKSMLSRLEAKLGQVNVNGLARYKEQAEALKEELGGLIDWQDFATKPKYESLCEEMDSLAEAEVDAQPDSIEARVEAVKALQNAWKELGRSDASEEFWARFQEAGHKAYEPAKVFFEALQQQRQNNLLKRQALCEQLTAELEQAIERGNWKALEKQVANARRAWHNYRGVERKAGKLVKVRFDHLLERIQLILAPQYEAGITAKQALIQKMEALAEMGVSQHVLHQTKELQAAWKVTGITPREDDQSLWNSFNGLCKQVFDAERAQRSAQRAEENQSYTMARTIIDELKALLPESGAERFQALQRSFSELQWKERDRDADKLKAAYERACEQFESKKDQLAVNLDRNDLLELQRRAQLCTALETTGTVITDDVWQQNPLEQPRWLKAIEQRKTKAMAGAKPDKASTRARRLLCIQLEILLDQDSPRDDKPLRMEYQLSQLQNRNRNQRNTLEILEEVRITWYTSLSATSEFTTELEPRFMALSELAGQ